MDVNVINELQNGLSAAYINGSVAAKTVYHCTVNWEICNCFLLFWVLLFTKKRSTVII